MKKNQKLSRASLKAFADFDDAAQHWGYIQDQGVGSEVNSSEASYQKAYLVLRRRLLNLERDNAKLRAYKRHNEEGQIAP